MFRGDRRLMGGGLVEERHGAMMGGEVRGEVMIMGFGP